MFTEKPAVGTERTTETILTFPKIIGGKVAFGPVKIRQVYEERTISFFGLPRTVTEWVDKELVD